MDQSNPNINDVMSLDELPAQVQAELLALIDGELDEGTERAVLARWASQPRLAATIAALVRDRAVLRGVGDVAAPAGLLDGVETYLEREALAGLSEGRVISPLPRVEAPGRGWLFGGSRRWVSIAAGVALLAGGTMYLTWMGWMATRHSRTDRGYLATLPTRPQSPSVDGGTGDARGGELAKADAAHDAVSSAGAPSSVAPAAPANAHVESGAVAAASQGEARAVDGTVIGSGAEVGGPAAGAAIDAAKAFELAREGRLAIRVIASDPALAMSAAAAKVNASEAGATFARLDSRGSTGLNSAGSNSASSNSIMALAASLRRDRASGAPAGNGPGATAAAAPVMASREAGNAAGGGTRASDGGQNRALGVDARKLAVVIEVGVLRAPASAAELGEAIRQLGARKGATVELVELEQSVSVDAPIDAGELMWWTRPASEWVVRVTAPVFFETP